MAGSSRPSFRRRTKLREGRLHSPRDVSNVLRMVSRVLSRAGLPWAASHTFRRTVASWMDADGAGHAEIATQLGHANVNVTAGYLGRKVQPTRATSVMVTPPRTKPRV